MNSRMMGGHSGSDGARWESRTSVARSLRNNRREMGITHQRGHQRGAVSAEQ
jgi:hypothetical protein